MSSPNPIYQSLYFQIQILLRALYVLSPFETNHKTNMRVFVTGASGWIGSAILPELISAGHQVIGLARSDASADAISAFGAEVHRGDLSDLESLRAGAAKADGVIHLAFIHDFSIYAQAAETDRFAIEALGNALVDSGKPFIVTSGTMMLPRGSLATEDTRPDMTNPMTSLRGRNEAVALAFASRAVRVSVVRLPPVNASSLSLFSHTHLLCRPSMARTIRVSP